MHGVDPWRNASWQEEEASVSAEENRALVRRLLEAEDKGDLDALDELLAPDFVDHNPLPGQEPGREGYIQGSHRITPPSPSPSPPSTTRQPTATW
jgi:ketosteroid isomerase-like protein